MKRHRRLQFLSAAFLAVLASPPVGAQPAGARRPRRAHQDRPRPRHRRGPPARLRQLRRAPRPLHLRRHLRRRQPALRRGRLPQRRHGRREGARRHASCAGRAATSPPATTGRTASARGTSVRSGRDQAWDAIECNRFGTDEFLKYCETLGVEPYICINAGLGTVEDARNWVEYTQRVAATPTGREQRRKNGRDKPWNVKIWGLGNEIDGPWQLGHKNAEDYAKFALEAAKAMRARGHLDQADRLRLLQLRAERGLGRLEPHGARQAEERDRLHLAPHLYRQPREQPRRSSWPISQRPRRTASKW